MSDRTLVLTSPHMRGDDVTGLQGDVNRRLAAWDVSLVLDVDGDYGMVSRDAAASCLYGLGVDEGGGFDGVSPTDRLKIRHGWDSLTSEEKTRQRDRAGWRKRLADRYSGGSVEVALAFARARIGVTENPAGSNSDRGTGATGSGKNIDRWERMCLMGAGPWCGCFVNACLVAAGFPSDFRLRFCPSLEGMAKSGQGGWSWVPAGGTVRPGDVVLYGSSVAQHQGLVETVSGGRDTSTIEGNTGTGPGGSQSNGGIVARRRRHTDGSLGGFPIRGYARPSW
jgi:hypothetical protein